MWGMGEEASWFGAALAPQRKSKMISYIFREECQGSRPEPLERLRYLTKQNYNNDDNEVILMNDDFNPTDIPNIPGICKLFCREDWPRHPLRRCASLINFWWRLLLLIEVLQVIKFKSSVSNKYPINHFDRKKSKSHCGFNTFADICILYYSF